MWRDPIVEEVRKNREEIFSRFGNDLGRYIRFLQDVEKQRRVKAGSSKSKASRTKSVRTRAAAKSKVKSPGVNRKPSDRRAA